MWLILACNTSEHTFVIQWLDATFQLSLREADQLDERGHFLPHRPFLPISQICHFFSADRRFMHFWISGSQYVGKWNGMPNRQCLKRELDSAGLEADQY